MSVKIDIISGFLGAGKTTLINRLLEPVTKVERVAVVENEFGEINIDSRILSESGVKVTEITSGCICCTLFGDFVKAMTQLLEQYPLDRIIVEPTGVGRLSDVVSACRNVMKENDARLNMLVTVVDCLNYEQHSKMFGQFFHDQVENAKVIFLSRTQKAKTSKVDQVVLQIKKSAPQADIITHNWDEMSGDRLISIAEQNTFDPASFVENIFKTHTGDPSSLEVWHKKTDIVYTRDQIRNILEKFDTAEEFSTIVRAKGFLKIKGGKSILFNYVPGEISITDSMDQGGGEIVVIGKKAKSSKLEALFENV